MPVSSQQVPLDTAKTWAKRLARFTHDNASPAMKLHQAQAAVASMLGFNDWHALTLHLGQPVKTPAVFTPPPLGSSPTTREEWEGLWHSLLQNEDHIAIHFEKRRNGLKIRVQMDGVFKHGWTGCPSGAVDALLTVAHITEHMELLSIEDGYAQGTLNPTTANPQYRLRFQKLPVYPEGMDAVVTRAALNPRRLDKHWFPAHQRLLLNATRLIPGLFAVVGTSGSGRTSLACHLIESLASQYRKTNPPLKILAWMDDRERPLQVGNTLHRGQHTLAELQKTVAHGLDVLFVDDLLNHEEMDVIQGAVKNGTTVFMTMNCASEHKVPMRLADFCGESSPGKKVRDLKLQLSVYVRLLPLLCPECSNPQKELSERRGCVFCGGTGTSGRILQAEAVTWNANQESTPLWPHRSHVNALLGQQRVSIRDAEELLGPLSLPSQDASEPTFEDIAFEHNGQI